MTQKMIYQVLAYLFTFWLGAMMVILSNLDTISTFDWVEIGLDIFFTAYFVYQATKQYNNPQIL
jgi:hypothetical protein